MIVTTTEFFRPLRRGIAVVSLLALGMLLLAGCGGGGQREEKAEQQPAKEEAAAHEVFVGRLTDEVAMVGIDAGEEEPGGASREVRAYVCDGLGPPDGKVAWFRGSLDGDTADLTSADGEQGLRLALGDGEAFGTYTDAEGAAHPFEAPLASAGAAIYEMAITEGDSHDFSGTSTDGGRSFEARDEDEDGSFEGVISDFDGEEIEFEVDTLGFEDADELREDGLPTTYARFQNDYNVPDTYFAIVSPGGGYWFGRGGNIRDGTSNKNIVAAKSANAGDFSNSFTGGVF